jgi:hypothetical protein
MLIRWNERESRIFSMLKVLLENPLFYLFIIFPLLRRAAGKCRTANLVPHGSFVPLGKFSAARQANEGGGVGIMTKCVSRTNAVSSNTS